MDKRVDIQFARIVRSVDRLTRGTPLEGTVVRLRRSMDSERLAFCVFSPTGPELVHVYRGILLRGLESWTDHSLDQRLYDSSNPAVRHLLNVPNPSN
jgi:hypothetical protein